MPTGQARSEVKSDILPGTNYSASFTLDLMAIAAVQPADAGADDDPQRASRPSRLKGWQALAALLVIGVSASIGVMVFLAMDRSDGSLAVANAFTPPAPYDAKRCELNLRRICDLGPRPSGSEAMRQQQALLERYFVELGATVEFQAFNARDPETGRPVELKNLIARFYPERSQRYLVCAHYDTRPFPDRDPYQPRGVFVGANDGGSGVAGLMELAHHMPQLPESIGVDLVLFDGEELVYQERRDNYFLGSTYFANQYVAQPPQYRYRAGILLDMIGDRELKIYYERNSWNYARDVCKSVFETAASLQVDHFVAKVRHELRDDHLPLNQIAKIPTIDLIDFDYPRPGLGAPQYWHTTKDVPENCSGRSIATVVYVAHQWLMRQ